MLKAVLDEVRLLSEKSQNPNDEDRIAAQDTRESLPNLTLWAGHDPRKGGGADRIRYRPRRGGACEASHSVVIVARDSTTYWKLFHNPPSGVAPRPYRPGFPQGREKT